jgi:hypothetical protein
LFKGARRRICATPHSFHAAYATTDVPVTAKKMASCRVGAELIYDIVSNKMRCVNKYGHMLVHINL